MRVNVCYSLIYYKLINVAVLSSTHVSRTLIFLENLDFFPRKYRSLSSQIWWLLRSTPSSSCFYWRSLQLCINPALTSVLRAPLSTLPKSSQGLSLCFCKDQQWLIILVERVKLAKLEPVLECLSLKQRLFFYPLPLYCLRLFFFFVGRRIELARFCLCFCKVIKLISFSVVGSNCCRYRGQDCNLDFSPKRCAVLYNMKNA